MNQSDDFSDEFLNAFIDGELDDNEKSRVLGAVCRDEQLNARICELQKLRELLQFAYKHPPVPPRHGNPGGKTSNRFGAGIAASLILMVGGTIGWQVHDSQAPRHELIDIVQSLKAGQPHSNQAEPWQVVLHVTTADPYRMKTVLDEAEGLLQKSAASSQGADVEILVNGPGLNLLRADTSPYAERIRQLQANYDRLTFRACQNAINRLQREKNITVTLLPEAGVVPSAIGEVINRQRQGWAYIQI